MNNILYYKNKSFQCNKDLNYENLREILSIKNLEKILNKEENLLRLKKFLPKNLHKILNNAIDLFLLLNTKTKFFTPIQLFSNLFNNNFFTKNYQENLPYFYQENLDDFINKKLIIFNEIKNTCYKKILNNQNNTQNDDFFSFIDNPILPSSGYTSDESNSIEIIKKNSISSNISLSSSFEMNKKEENSENFSELSSSFFNIKTKEKIPKKRPKSSIIPPRTQEEINSFRKQEKIRYLNPHLPWQYKFSNGLTSIVAPVFKKSKTVITKVREHKLLKDSKPSYLTILSLVRDAASRLPNGIGTRMDVCDLLRDSQYINENITEKEINHIVSGALDRLHYEKDPCVKYNPHEKLWVYIHKNRDLDFKGWKDDLIFEENKNIINNDNNDENDNKGKSLNKIKKRISSYLEKNLDNHLGNKRKREKHKHSHSHSHNKNKDSKHKHHHHNSKNNSKINSNNSSKNIIKLND